MNFDLDELVKHLSDKDFQHLVEEFGSKIELLKQKGTFPDEYMNSFERVKEKKIDC